MKHSILGIISFAISIVIGTSLILTIGIGIFLTIPQSRESIEQSQLEEVLGGVIFIQLVINLLGGILGVCGIFEKDKGNFFSYCGAFINFAVIFLLTVVIIIGNYL